MGFQFKPELSDKIMKGLKTQTRRPDKEGDYGDAWVTTIYRNGRKLWKIGQVYAIQPGRGKKGVGFLRITNIRNEDVRYISHTDAVAEGFNNRIEFLRVWCSFYDPQVSIIDSIPGRWTVEYKVSGVLTYRWAIVDEQAVIDGLLTRPNDLYRAHVIDFKLEKSPESVRA